MFINLQSDAILRKLRAESTMYSIPFGGFFYILSAPHFFGEIIQWIGFCIACNFSLATVAFYVYTSCNLIPRGIDHHQWYKDKFGDKYPNDRWAVIPYVC